MLHGYWSIGRGLLLWQDDLEPAPTGALGELARMQKFRHSIAVKVPGELASPRSAYASSPDRAARLLLTAGDDVGLAGDLRYLRHVARGIEVWVRAGRIVPDIYRAEGEWWARWCLVGGAAQRAWLAELAAAMPAVQHAEGTPHDVLADICRELTGPIAASIIGAPRTEYPLATALVTGDPIPLATHQMGTVLQQWRETLRAGEPELVLRLGEPDDDSPAEIDALWRLEVCLRSEGEAPKAVQIRGGDPKLLQIAIRKLGDAMSVYPRLRDVPADQYTLDLLLPTPVVIDLVAHGAEALRAHGFELLLPRAWRVESPTLRVKVSSSPTVAVEGSAVGMNELVDYDWELALGDTVLTHEEMIQLAKAKSDLVRLRGSWVQADHRVVHQALRYLVSQAEEQPTLGTLIGTLAGHAPPPVPVEEIQATGWVAGLLDARQNPEPVPIPSTLKATLRPYQERGLNWLAFMDRHSLGAVLADDMGLGKTVQVLSLLAHEREERRPLPTLLVCPMSVVGNWQREAAKFVPGLQVLVHHGAGRHSGDAFADAAAKADLVITTYALLARDIAHLKESRWERIVLDEAQYVKNASTGQAKAARSIPARHRLAMTGTPVENRLEELRSLLDFVNPKMLGSAQSFRARFAVPIEREKDELAAARLRMVTGPFVLRRVKTDPTIISDLPEKVEMTIHANLTSEQATLYQAIVDDMLRQIEQSEGMGRKGAVLATLSKLKQVCNHPAHFLGDGSGVMRRGHHRSGKLALVEDVLDSVLADGEKALLFTQFKEFGDLVAPYLAERFGIEIPFLHGGVSKSRRDDMVERFQGPDGPPIMLLSLKAGGTGLNLTAANHVVHLDRWWNPAVENQATDRAFRIGQRKNVQVRKLVCVGTVEERIDAMLESKKELADLVVGTGEGWVTELGNEELRELLRLDRDAVAE
ncbi:DEAD/DEAH box helicase [Smaragdicoccus niigatensis]|uniref:DEAD/DEAH box helicase n=1 Tax=Smaragdicoccus niigatensis TaxID=359359 RepID=UPI00037A6E47|nr:DEAD/DEAH box helicase [Smaragdicoccus niigatensis]